MLHGLLGFQADVGWLGGSRGAVNTPSHAQMLSAALEEVVWCGLLLKKEAM